MTDVASLVPTSAADTLLSKNRVTSAQLFGPPPPQSPPKNVTTLPLTFTGEAGEYFRIWIVNVMLSVVTLGIYSPWARVRTRQYFYGHTWLDGHNFEYTARPAALLRGFLLVGALFVVYAISQQVPRYQWLSVLMLLLFGGLYPWLVYRSLKFNAANTVYRGLSFHFHGTVGGAYVAYLLIVLSAPFTAGLTFPLAVWMQRRYLLQHAAYGTSRTGWAKDVGPVYLIYLTAVAVSLALGVLTLLLLGLAALIAGRENSLNDLLGLVRDSLNTGASTKHHGPQGSEAVLVGLAVGAGLLSLLFIFASHAIGQYVRAALLKYSLHDLYVGQTLRLQATFNPVRLAWIGTSNLVAQVFTLGLLTPWAAVRRTRYLLAGVQVQTTSALDGFSADTTPGGTVLGEAAHEFFNFDLGF